MTEIMIGNIQEFNTEKGFSQILDLMPIEFQSIIKKIKVQNIKKQQVLSRMMIYKAYHEYSGSFDKTLALVTNQWGKPAIINSNDFRFNVSHSVNFVVLAIDNADIGIDIECVRNINFNIAKNFFSEYEYNWIISANSETLKKDRFFRVWTLKEAYLKYLGTGLSKPLKSFEYINLENSKPYVIDNGENVDLCINSCKIYPEIWCSSVATNYGFQQIKNFKLNTEIEQFYKYFR